MIFVFFSVTVLRISILLLQTYTWYVYLFLSFPLLRLALLVLFLICLGKLLATVCVNVGIFWFLGFFEGVFDYWYLFCAALRNEKMSANQEVTSPSPCGAAHAKKSVDKLSVKEFHERFCIPNGVSIELTDGEAVSTENSEDQAIFFSKEQFNAGLLFPLPSLFKEFLHFTQIPPAYIHPNMVRVLMGCSILNMLFNLDLTLLDVLFIYSIKKLKTDIFSFVACLPSM